MHVVVTGGSSGIGLEVARIYARRGARVSLIARNLDQLELAARDLSSGLAAGEGAVAIQSADISVEAEISAAFAACESRFGPCDILIASAGMVEPGRFDEQDGSVFAHHINVNLLGTANAVRAAYAGMRSRARGKIMIVSSGAALIGIPGYSAYCASKSALAGFAEALRTEAAMHGVSISICFPPDTDTPQFVKELPKRPPEARALMGAAPPWSADAVARNIVAATDRGRAKLHFGFSITMLGLFGPLIKPFVFAWFRPRRRR